MSLVTVAEYRDWAGAQASSVSDFLIEATLAESAAALSEEVDAPIERIEGNPNAAVIARGDVLRRSSNLLAARNSPEGTAGVGEYGSLITVPSGHPTSQRAVRQIRAALGIPEPIA